MAQNRWLVHASVICWLYYIEYVESGINTEPIDSKVSEETVVSHSEWCTIHILITSMKNEYIWVKPYMGNILILLAT